MATTIEEIRSHETYQIYDVICFDQSVMTTVTNNPHKVTEWISDMESIYGAGIFGEDDLLIIGLDIEWRTSYSSNRPPVAIVQLCINERCLIFQLTHARYIPDSLANFLSDQAYTFVGVGVKSDLEKLNRDYQIGRNAKVVDLGRVAGIRYGRTELKNWGLKDLARLVLGKEMEKPKAVTMSPWDNRWLTPDQVEYACLDAFVSYEIGVNLGAENYRDVC